MRDDEDVEYELERKRGCFLPIFMMLLLAAGVTLYWKRHDWKIEQIITSYREETAPKPKPDPIKYEALKSELANERIALRRRYLSAKTTREQDEVLSDASSLLEHSMPELMRCWLGHPWDFHGTATVPGEGKIACGYFVSVIMRDTGFAVQRIKLAQQPSQNIIKTFVPRKKMWVKVGVPYEEYADKLQSDYDGISIVGLDKHVAFVVIKNGKLHFIHSGGVQRLVVDEHRYDAYALRVSNYRVIANISKDKDVLRKWILNQPFPTAS